MSPKTSRDLNCNSVTGGVKNKFNDIWAGSLWILDKTLVAILLLPLRHVSFRCNRIITVRLCVSYQFHSHSQTDGHKIWCRSHAKHMCNESSFVCLSITKLLDVRM